MTDDSRETEAAAAEAEALDDADEAIEDADGTDEADEPAARSEATDELWEEVGVDPIKVALPREVVGYTLRAYRPASQVTPTEAAEVDDEDDPFAERERARAAEEADFAIDEAELTAEALAADPADSTGRDEADDRAGDDDADEAGDDEPEDAGAAEEEAAEEEPVFLSHKGKLLLFATPEALVTFLRSDAPHDLTQLDSWPTLVKQVRPEDIVPTEEDTYELDLVVENLRGGHEAWDLSLLIYAGELSRDLGQALRLTPVVNALAPGSPLDDLDEALRAAHAGGFGKIFARRRLRRIGAQQASLGWRTVIGKISAAVDWRD